MDTPASATMSPDEQAFFTAMEERLRQLRRKRGIPNGSRWRRRLPCTSSAPMRSSEHGGVTMVPVCWSLLVTAPREGTYGNRDRT